MRIKKDLRLKGYAYSNGYNFKILIMLFSVVISACTNSHKYTAVDKPYDKYMDSPGKSIAVPGATNREFTDAGLVIMNDSLAVTAPFSEALFFSPDLPRAVSYKIKGVEGQNLVMDIKQADSSSAAAAVSVEVYEMPAGKHAKPSPLPVAAFDRAGGKMEYEFGSNNYYIIRLQPDLLKFSKFSFNISSRPVLRFPINGLTSDFVSSGWGEPRDSGQRKHEGVDIMSPTGTPVLAVAEGYVSFVGWNNLGGNVVSVVDLDRGLSYYYAHLSKQITKVGRKVSAGDTLGLVGNTGDAITTPPHLHFGIYTFSYGAVDPMPYLKKETAEARTALKADLAMLGQAVRPSMKDVVLRKDPAIVSGRLSRLKLNETAIVTGVGSNWYRVISANGRSAYVPVNSIALAGSPQKETIKEKSRSYAYYNFQAGRSGSRSSAAAYIPNRDNSNIPANARD